MTKRSPIAHSSTQHNGSCRHFGSSSYLQSRSRNKGSTRNTFSPETSESSVAPKAHSLPTLQLWAQSCSISLFYSSAMHKCGICGMDARLPRVYFRNSRILRHKKVFPLQLCLTVCSMSSVWWAQAAPNAAELLPSPPPLPYSTPLPGATGAAREAFLPNSAPPTLSHRLSSAAFGSAGRGCVRMRKHCDRSWVCPPQKNTDNRQ